MTIQIDGSYGEGGGQILRTSLALSALTGQPVQLTKIRAGRSKPGLAAQHLAAVEAAAAICNAEVTGAALGSQELVFQPGGKVAPSQLQRFTIGTAGAAPLVAQTVAVPLLMAGGKSRVEIVGGTHVPFAPTADYLRHVYQPALATAFLDLDVQYDSAGYNPKGGGELVLNASTRKLPRPLDWVERGRLKRLDAIVVSTELPLHVSDRGMDALRKLLAGREAPVHVTRGNPPGPAPGAAILLHGATDKGLFGFVALGQLGKPIERVAEDAVADFDRWWQTGAATEEHLADQLVLPLALAPGVSRWTTPVASEHLRTVLWTVRHFLPIEHRIEERGRHVLVTLKGAPPR